VPFTVGSWLIKCYISLIMQYRVLFLFKYARNTKYCIIVAWSILVLERLVMFRSVLQVLRFAKSKAHLPSYACFTRVKSTPAFSVSSGLLACLSGWYIRLSRRNALLISSFDAWKHNTPTAFVYVFILDYIVNSHNNHCSRN